ncbi:hypothetical protein TRIP_E370047 [uncultured Spirochaetota bacterium]|uniref:Uncharacterized protein n=1 Tax=uncultured Spirochaetota bacterium TaxID=460511 RepID=A0A652ZYG8_9SPIR|nr:hypothetical protein TRIP_E370047 [uncultured Spirochaetota bacterium]
MFGYGSDMNIVDVHIVAFNEEEKEVQGAFEILEAESPALADVLQEGGRTGVVGGDFRNAIHQGQGASYMPCPRG